jgi:DNA-binding NarL/FixJ family response regulator
MQPTETRRQDPLVSPRVLVVDDHAVFRQATRALLEADGFDVIGEAATGQDGLRDAAALRPDLVLLDVRLPDMDGFAVAERLRSLHSGAPCVVLVSSRGIEAYGSRVAASPANGFLPKSELSGAALRGFLS